MNSREATQYSAVLNEFMPFVNKRLTPDTIDEIVEALTAMMKEGPTSWAFKEKKDD